MPWRKAMKRILIVLFFTVTTLAQSETGMYLDRGADQVKMTHAQFAGMESKGTTKSMFVPGAAIRIVWDFRGSTATVQTGANPKFVYQGVAAQDFVLVRLEQKSDRRQVRVCKVSAVTGGMRVGFDPKTVVELRVVRKGNTIEIAPTQILVPGEYFLAAGFSSSGYDFSVSK
jgi:hypothetical protein